MSVEQALVGAVAEFERAVRDAQGYFADAGDFAVLNRARRHLLDVARRRQVGMGDRADEAYRQGREHEAYDRDGEVVDLRARADRAERALREAVKAFEEADRCAWLLHSAIGSGDSALIDAAVEQYERSHDEKCMGPDAPMTRARAALPPDAEAKS